MALSFPPRPQPRAPSVIPLHRQIYHQIAREIRAGAIPHAARLASTRTLALLLGVSRNTVLAAYQDLAAADLVRGEPGAGMRVHAGPPVPEASWFGLKQAIRASGYPARVLTLPDADGNPLYIRF